MKLYDAVRAPNPRRVRIFLAEKGLDIPTELVDLANMQHRGDNFTAINPVQRVPVLMLDDGTAIAETMPICRYLEELHPEPNLFGHDPLERAKVGMWSRFVEHGLFSMIAHAFRHIHPGMASFEVPQVPAWGEANREKALVEMTWLDGELATRGFIAGNRFTVADITAIVAIDFLRAAKLSVPDQLGHLKRWQAEVSAPAKYEGLILARRGRAGARHAEMPHRQRRGA